MGRTLLTLALVLTMATVFGLQSRKLPQQGRVVLDSDVGMVYRVSLNGVFAGWAKSPRSKPAGSQTAPSQIKVLLPATVGKGGGDVAMEEITLMAEPFYEWIRASMHGRIGKTGDITLKRGVVGAAPFADIVLKRGVIQSFAPDMTPAATIEFLDAMITEVTFPPLNASSKDAAYMTIKISADDIKNVKGDGKKAKVATVPATKKWKASDFKIKLGDLPCTRVTKVSSLTWKKGVARDEIGRSRESTGQASNIRITLPMQDWNAWENWLTRSLLSSEDELSGSITYLGPDLDESYTIELLNVGIIAMSAQKADANSGNLETFVVELQINETDFNFVRR